MKTLSESDERRFWSKVDVRGDDECWPWVAKSRLPTGYGVFKLATGRSGGVQVVSSRIAANLAYGPPPFPGARTLHSCDNPPCCNPNHLRWGTQKDNVHDAIERKRHVPPPRNAHYRVMVARRGEDAANSRLTETVVRKIWSMHLTGRNATEIAQNVGHSVAAVYDVCRGRTWRHLAGAPTIEELKQGGAPHGTNQFSAGCDTRSLSWKTKIAAGQIPEILQALKRGERGVDIAKRYGVSKSTISRIKVLGR